jgi:DNA-binding MarR family transcriptional regulator
MITYMNPESQDPISIIERALVTMRRDQQRRRLQRRGGHPHRGRGDGSLGGAARFRMLDALAAAPGMSVSDIADAIGVDQPRASRLVNDAVAAGFVRRAPDPEDGRRSVLELSALGQRMLGSAHEARRAAVVRALEGFTASETEAFAGMLDRFVANWPRD